MPPPIPTSPINTPTTRDEIAMRYICFIFTKIEFALKSAKI